MKRIAIIENSYVRDAQVLSVDPEFALETLAWDDSFIDVKYPSLYLGVFEGIDEDEIQKKAADSQGVHPNIISLIALEQEADSNIVEVYVCPVCENEEHSSDAIFCKICGEKIRRVSPADIDTFEFNHFRTHAGHNIEVVMYGGDWNVSVECIDCGEVLYSVDNPEIEKDEEEPEITVGAEIINKVFYKGSGDIPMTTWQLAKEAGFNFTPWDYPERISGNGHCRCKNGGEFILLPKYDPSVIESGGKRYMRCRICGCVSHL